MQHAILITLFALYAFGIYGTVNVIGISKKPLTKERAAVIVVAQTAIVALLVTLW